MEDNKPKKEKKSKSCLDEDTLSYFKRVESVIEEDEFEDQEARNLFVENVFTQVEGNELELSCDQNMSRVLERLLQHFSDAQTRTVWSNLAPNYKTITNDKFGSHVIQNLVNSVPNTIRAERSKVKEVDKQDEGGLSMEELFLSYCSFIGEEFEECVSNTYSSHVVRAVLEVLAGVRVSDNVQRSRNSKGVRQKTYGLTEHKNFGRHTKSAGQAFGKTHIMPTSEAIAVPESFSLVLKSVTSTAMAMDLDKLLFHPLSNPVLQTLLLVLHYKHEKLCTKLCKKIIKESQMFDKKRSKAKQEKQSKETSGGSDDDGNKTDSYQVPILLSHQVSSHLVEKLFHVATPKLHTKLYKTFFKSHLDFLVQHPICNYLVQHLLASTTDPTLGEAILDELLTEIEDILASGHDGVIARMAETCVRLGIRQEEMTDALLAAFHCTGKEERKSCATLLLTVTTHDIFYGTETNGKDEESEDKGEEVEYETTSTQNNEKGKSRPTLNRVNFHGAVLMKSLLEFEDIRVYADSLLGLTKEELLLVSCDQIGSHTIEGYMKSKTVGERRKHKLVNKLRGEFAKFATDKHASHVVETCWRQSDIKHKELISQELVDAEHHIAKDFYGAKVLKSCDVENFKKTKQGWSEKQGKATKKRQMFEELLNDTGKEKKRKKKNEHPETQQGEMVSKYSSEMAQLGFQSTEHSEELIGNKAIKKKDKKSNESDVIEMIFKQKEKERKPHAKKRKAVD